MVIYTNFWPCLIALREQRLVFFVLYYYFVPLQRRTEEERISELVKGEILPHCTVSEKSRQKFAFYPQGHELTNVVLLII